MKFQSPEPIQAHFQPPQESVAVYRIGKDLICSVFCVERSLPVPVTAAESPSYGAWNSTHPRHTNFWLGLDQNREPHITVHTKGML